MAKKNTLQNVIELRLVADNLAILTRYGLDFACPFVPPTAVKIIRQSPPMSTLPPTEEVAMQKQTCNTGCPLFQFDMKTKKVSVSCGGTKTIHNVSKIISVEEQMKAKKESIITDFNISKNNSNNKNNNVN